MRKGISRTTQIGKYKRYAPISLVVVIAEPVETALLVHELEGCECVRARRLEIEGTLAVLPLNESAFGESAAAMAVDCS